MRQAEQTRARVVEDANRAYAAIDKLQRDAEALSKRIDDAVDALATARSDGERDAAKATLDQLRKDKYEVELRIADARAAARVVRLEGDVVTP